MTPSILKTQAPYFVELLGRHGEVKLRHRFEALPITIGRSYANDVILDDASVAQFHAVIEATETNELYIRELGSQQGIIHEGKRVSRLMVNGHQVVKLGVNLMRVRNIAFIAHDDTPQQVELQSGNFYPALASLLLLTSSSTLSIWMNNTGQFSIASYLFGIAVLFVLVMLWSGCWAFANRVIDGHPRFFRHLLIVSTTLLLIDASSVISMIIGYAFSLEFISAYGNHIAMMMVSIMIYYHLTTISHHHPKRFTTICTLFALVGSGLIFLTNYQRSGQFADELYMPYLLPPAIQQSVNQDAAQFIREAQALKLPLDKKRLEAIDNTNSVFDGDY